MAFIDPFYNTLNGIPERNRGDGFAIIFDVLEKSKERYQNILETGTMRPNGTMEGDGQSTLLFREYAKQSLIERSVYVDTESVDINPACSEQFKSRYSTEEAFEITNRHGPYVRTLVHFHIGDSVKYLYERGKKRKQRGYDLVYLDSYDVDFNNPQAANLHHLKELCAIRPMIRRGTIVAVDDCRFNEGDHRIPLGVKAKEVGKGVFVESFMNDVGAKLIHDGYQKIWKIK